MEQKNNFENFLVNMYDFYIKNSFKDFNSKILNYNIAIGTYKKDISKEIKNVFDNILKIDFKDLKFKYREFNHYYLMELSSKSLEIDENILLDIPIFLENVNDITLNLVNYCFENNIDVSIKLNKQIKNTILQLKVFNSQDANRLIDHFINNKEIKEIIKSRTLPFLYQIGLIGIYSEIKPYSFKNIFIQYLYLYYSKVNSYEDVSLESFIKYIELSFKNERRNNKKRILSLLYNYLLAIINDDNIFDVFKTNSIMDLSSFNARDYNLKLDENKMIYFVDKLDSDIEIRYDNEDYFNVAYSKYYDNVIKQEKGLKYYYLFYNTYDKILVNHYNYIDDIFNMLNPSLDRINKILLISSSLFFAHKKLNFTYKQIKSIMDYVLINIDDNNLIKTEKNIYLEKYVLDRDYANKIIPLLNGNEIMVKDYLYDNNIINDIPSNCIIELKDGSKISGKEFIENLYKYIPYYNNFQELTKNLIETIEY